MPPPCKLLHVAVGWDQRVLGECLTGIVLPPAAGLEHVLHRSRIRRRLHATIFIARHRHLLHRPLIVGDVGANRQMRDFRYPELRLDTQRRGALEIDAGRLAIHRFIRERLARAFLHGLLGVRVGVLILLHGREAGLHIDPFAAGHHIDVLAGGDFLRLLCATHADLTGRLGHVRIREALRLRHVHVEWRRSQHLRGGIELIADRIHGERRRYGSGAAGKRQRGNKRAI